MNPVDEVGRIEKLESGNGDSASCVHVGAPRADLRAVARRLRVGVPLRIALIPRATGHGNVWGHLPHELGGLVEIVAAEPCDPAGPVDVWLADGHGLPLAVSAPVVAVVHEAGWNTDFLRSLYESEFLKVIDRQTAACCRAAAAVITPSGSACSQVVDHYGVAREKVHVVPYGVDHSIFRPGLKGGVELVASAGGDSRRPYILCVGQVHPRKNFAAVRAALDDLALKGFPHQLVTVSRAPVRGADHSGSQRAAALPLPLSGRAVVSITRPSDVELAALMASAAAFCQPSFMEGFGLTVLEAMACGVPVVVSDRGSLPEVVDSAGTIVPPTADALARALAKLLRDPKRAEEMGRRAQLRAAEFGWNRTAAGWLAAIKTVVPSPAPGDSPWIGFSPGYAYQQVRDPEATNPQ